MAAGGPSTSPSGARVWKYNPSSDSSMARRALGRGGRRELDLGLDLIRDPDPHEQVLEIDAGRALLDIGDRLCVAQRVLEGFGRADVRLGRALADRDADAGAREIGPAGDNLALFRQFVEPGVGKDDEVGGLAAVLTRLQPPAD